MATIKEIMIEQEKIEMKVCTKEGLDGVSFDGEYIIKVSWI